MSIPAILVSVTRINQTYPDRQLAVYEVSKLPPDVLGRIEAKPDELWFENVFYGLTLSVLDGCAYVSRLQAAKTLLRHGQAIPPQYQIVKVLSYVTNHQLESLPA